MSSVLSSPVAVDARLVPTTSVPSRYVAQLADHFGRQVHDPLAQLVADALRRHGLRPAGYLRTPRLGHLPGSPRRAGHPGPRAGADGGRLRAD